MLLASGHSDQLRKSAILASDLCDQLSKSAILVSGHSDLPATHLFLTTGLHGVIQPDTTKQNTHYLGILFAHHYQTIQLLTHF